MVKKKKEPEKLEEKLKLKEEPLTRMAIIDINQLREISPEIAYRVYLLYRELMRIRHELNESMNSEKEAWGENVRLQAELESEKKQNEILRATLSNMQNRLDEKVRAYNQLKLQVEDLELRSAIAQTSYMSLLDSLETLHQMVTKRYTESIPEMVRNEMLQNIEMLISQLETLLTPVMRIKEKTKEVTPPAEK